jgi:hypothetical protein
MPTQNRTKERLSTTPIDNDGNGKGILKIHLGV